MEKLRKKIPAVVINSYEIPPELNQYFVLEPLERKKLTKSGQLPENNLSFANFMLRFVKMEYTGELNETFF